MGDADYDQVVVVLGVLRLWFRDTLGGGPWRKGLCEAELGAPRLQQWKQFADVEDNSLEEFRG